MEKMTGRERIGNILRRQPVDRIGVFEHFWGDTHREWAKKAGLTLTRISPMCSTLTLTCAGLSTW